VSLAKVERVLNDLKREKRKRGGFFGLG